jgi:poly(3-hydroxybutyrate) depolymerase
MADMPYSAGSRRRWQADRMNGLLLFLCICSGFVLGTLPASALTVQRGPALRVAGTYTFNASMYTNAASVTWHVDRTLIDEVSGSKSTTPSIYTSTGASASFDLTKTPGSSTIYTIVAEEAGQADSVTVQVFTAGAISRFIYEGPNNVGKPLNIFLVVPASLGTSTHVVLVMHGTNRDADVYIASWQTFSSANNYVSVAPEFSTTYWPGTTGYHLGNQFTRDDTLGLPIQESEWTFTIADEIAKYILRGFGVSDSLYDIWGHSAGGQFVHRFMLQKPNTSVRIAIAANSGYYTLPDFSVPYACGLKHPQITLTPADLVHYTERPLMIMRGTADTLRDSDLNIGGYYDAQGLNRYQRAGFFYGMGAAINVATSWRLFDVWNSGHSQSTMAPAGQQLLLATAPPSAPTLVSPANGAVNQPFPERLQGARPPGSLMFQVQVSPGSDFATVAVDDSTISDTVYQADGLAASTKYYWRVRARNHLGVSDWSATWSFTTGMVMTATLLNESFGSTTTLPAGWTITGGGWTPSTGNVSSGYAGASGTTNISGSNSGTSPNCVLTYDNGLSTVGASNITVLWGARRSASFTNAVTFEWSSDGSVWNAVPYTEVPNTTTWMLVNNGVPISLGSGASNVANLRLRWRYAQINNASAYRVDDVVVAGDVLTRVGHTLSGVPAQWDVEPNYPNPFNPSTNFRIVAPFGGHASLRIYDLLGREVAVVIDQELPQGTTTISFNGSRLASGMYCYLLRAGNVAKTGKIVKLQ